MPKQASEWLPPFSAVLLAGGASRRMGRDKAGLLLEGIPLRERQLSLLRSLAPAELLLAGPGAAGEAEPVPDLVAGHGPLGGLAGALERMTSPRLLVLAVDLPLMQAACLRRLLALGTSGVIPRGEHGFEPLAAVYPRAALPLAREFLARGSLRLQDFAAALVEQGLAVACPILPAEAGCFRNTNTPEEWEAMLQARGAGSSK